MRPARTGGARTAAWRARAALGVCLAVAVGACSDVPVVQGVSEVEANRALAALDTAGIAARKESEESATGAAAFRVSVGPDEVARAVGVLNAQGLPRHEAPGYVETFGQASLVQTATEERARAAQAIAGELSRTIESIDGVIAARVHLSLADTHDTLLDDATPPRSTASVLVRYAGAQAPYDDDGLRRLVAGAVSGMRTEDVAVVGIARAVPAVTRSEGLARVGPFAVARASAGQLRGALAATLGLNLALAGAVVVLVARRRRTRGTEPR